LLVAVIREGQILDASTGKLNGDDHAPGILTAIRATEAEVSDDHPMLRRTPLDTRGVLHVCLEGSGEGPAPTDCLHVSEFVNGGEDGRYVDDNDIRGFLDGRFKFGWNQAGQRTVRVGRFRHPNRPPTFGEDELFRGLQRWHGIRLPKGSRVRGVRLSLHLHEPLDETRRFYLYAVRRPWNPGSGGVRGDDVSVPKAGEVWWQEARHGQDAWGLPGAGFASDSAADADTGLQPLAVAECEEGTREVHLTGERLSRHVNRRLDEDEDLLFLLKLSDWEEDTPGSLVEILSGEFGPDRTPSLRPRLRLEWTPPPSARCQQEEVFLEFGRQRTFAPMRLPPGTRLWATLAQREGYEGGTVQFREIVPGGEPAASEWQTMVGPVLAGTGWGQLRVLAARRPIVLGEPFSSRFRDNWVVSAPPEDQRLRWTFTSPSGIVHPVDAAYEGEFVWQVTFVPDEIGRWRTGWHHEFAGPIEVGPPDSFDVIASSPERVGLAVRALTEQARDRSPVGDSLEQALERLARLERAGMQGLSPEEYRSEPGHRLRDALDRARGQLSGRPLPSDPPHESMPLREEAGGRRFAEPIPRYNTFRARDYEGSSAGGGAASSVSEWARRLARGFQRLFRTGVGSRGP
jgi:hypothetical protein